MTQDWALLHSIRHRTVQVNLPNKISVQFQTANFKAAPHLAGDRVYACDRIATVLPSGRRMTAQPDCREARIGAESAKAVGQRSRLSRSPAPLKAQSRDFPAGAGARWIGKEIRAQYKFSAR